MNPIWSDALLAEIASFRYCQVCLAALWGWTSLRMRPVLALVFGTLFLQLTLGYWILVLGAPYGVGVDRETTRFVADAAVATGGNSESGFVSGMPRAANWLATFRAPTPIALWLPTLLPLVTSSAPAWLVWIAWRRRQRAVWASTLWLVFSTSDVSSLKGYGFLAGLWPRPGWSLIVLAWISIMLAADRLGRRALAVAIAGTSITVALWAPSSHSIDAGTWPFVGRILLEQGIWLLLGGIGLWRDRWGAPMGLVLSGALAVALGAGRVIDPWAGHTVVRLGLILAATRPIAFVIRRLYQSTPCRSLTTVLPGNRKRAGLALVVFVGASSGFCLRWNPIRWDGIAEMTALNRSLPHALRQSLQWLDAHTRDTDVVMVSSHYAPYVAAFAGRRVLRCPSLLAADDDGNRRLLERRLIRGRRWAKLAQRFGVTYLLVGPGDYEHLGLNDPEQLRTRPDLVLRHFDRNRFHVFEVDPTRAPSSSPPRPPHNAHNG